jgi:hypothetical protein
MPKESPQQRLEQLIIDSDPTSRFIAEIGRRLADRLPIEDMRSLRDALTASGPLVIGSEEISFEDLPKVPDGMLPIEDIPDLITKARAAVVFAHTVCERGLFSNSPHIWHLATAVTLATAPVDVPPPIMVGRGRPRPESRNKNGGAR